jgi:hypothetical protein
MAQMPLGRVRRAKQIAVGLISGMTLGAAPALSNEGLPLRFEAPSNWKLLSMGAGKAIFLADEEAKVTLIGGSSKRTAMEWAISEVEALKATATKPRALEGSKTLAGCRIVEGASVIAIHDRPMATLSADCSLIDGNRVVQLRLNEYAWNEDGWLVVAKLENVAHRLGSLERARLRQDLRSVHVGAAVPPSLPVRQAQRPAPESAAMPPGAPGPSPSVAANRVRRSAAGYSSADFGIVWKTPRSWRCLYQADEQSADALQPIPEGILSVHKKDYDGAASAHRYPSTLVLRVWDQEVPGTPLADEFSMAMGSIPVSDVTAGPDGMKVGDRLWLTGEFEQQLDTAEPPVMLKSKVYATLHKDRRGSDIVVMVKGSSLSEEYAQDEPMFDATVRSMTFRSRNGANMGLLKGAVRRLFGRPESSSRVR